MKNKKTKIRKREKCKKCGSYLMYDKDSIGIIHIMCFCGVRMFDPPGTPYPEVKCSCGRIFHKVGQQRMCHICKKKSEVKYSEKKYKEKNGERKLKRYNSKNRRELELEYHGNK